MVLPGSRPARPSHDRPGRSHPALPPIPSDGGGALCVSKAAPVGGQLAGDQLYVLDDGVQIVVGEMAAHKPAGTNDAERFGQQRLLV